MENTAVANSLKSEWFRSKSKIMAAPAPEQPVTPPGRKNSWLSWLVLFVVGTAAISLIVVYLPPRAKMLGLLAIGQGLLAGWLAAWLAAKFDLRSASGMLGLAAVFLIILGGQIGTTFESYRVYRKAEERRMAADPKRALAVRLLQSLPADAKSQKTQTDVRNTIGATGTSFTDYLQFRLLELKVESRRVATAFWISEVVLGTLAGTWIFRRLAPAGELEAPDPSAKLDE
jgi:hypothetical protein